MQAQAESSSLHDEVGKLRLDCKQIGRTQDSADLRLLQLQLRELPMSPGWKSALPCDPRCRQRSARVLILDVDASVCLSHNSEESTTCIKVQRIKSGRVGVGGPGGIGFF